MENENSGRHLTFKEYMKGAGKVLADYGVAFLLFAVLFYIFALITKSAMNKWLSVYSFLMFLLIIPTAHKDMNSQAVKDKRPAYGILPNPLRGLYFGLLAIAPLLLLWAVSRIIVFDQPLYNRLMHVGVNALYGPIYWIVRIGDESVLSYLLAPLSVVLISTASYLEGFHGLDLRTKLFGPPKRRQPVRKPQGGKYSG